MRFHVTNVGSNNSNGVETITAKLNPVGTADTPDLFKPGSGQIEIKITNPSDETTEWLKEGSYINLPMTQASE